MVRPPIVSRGDLTDPDHGGGIHFTLPVAIILAVIVAVALFFAGAIPVLAWRANHPHHSVRLVRNEGPLLMIGEAGKRRRWSQDEKDREASRTGSGSIGSNDAEELEKRTVQVMGVFGGDYPRRVEILQTGSTGYVQAYGTMNAESGAEGKGKEPTKGQEQEPQPAFASVDLGEGHSRVQA